MGYYPFTTGFVTSEFAFFITDMFKRPHLPFDYTAGVLGGSVAWLSVKSADVLGADINCIVYLLCVFAGIHARNTASIQGDVRDV